MNTDVLVYDDHDYYIGYFGEDGWYRWPAVADGWRKRKAHPAPTQESGAIEFPPFNAALALRLSGVE